jgi:hypothetical protein
MSQSSSREGVIVDATYLRAGVRFAVVPVPQADACTGPRERR